MFSLLRNIAALVVVISITATHQACSENLLAHSNFETPGDNFWGFGGSKFSENNLSSDAIFGQRSLKWPYTHPMLDWPLAAPTTGQHFNTLSYQEVTAEAGAAYSLSSYVKLDSLSSSRGTVRYKITAARPVRGKTPTAPIYSEYFNLTTSWQRYSWNVTLPEADNGQYVISIEFSGDPPWQSPYPVLPRTSGLIDAIQFEKGNTTEYSPKELIEIGLYPLADSNAFIWGESVLTELYIANNSDEQASLSGTLLVEDYWGNSILTKPIPLSIAAHARSKETVDLGSSLRGHFRMLLYVGGTIVTEKIFSVIPPSSDISPEESIFGADMSLSEYLLTLARKLGFRRARPHADLGWEFIEPTKGNFVFPDYRLNLAKQKGVLPYGFLYRIPTWAKATPSSLMPQNIEDWSNYVFKVVERYKNDISYWEIMNEPCMGMSGPDYVTLVEAARIAAKRADPNAKIGGWSTAIGNGATSYCYKDQRASLVGNMDFLTGHYYPSFVANTGKKLFETLKWHSDVISSGTLPLWNTEGGASGGSTFYRSKTDYNVNDERATHARTTSIMWINHKAANVPLYYYWLNFPSVGDHSPGYTYSWTFNEYDSSLKASAGTTAFAAYMLDGQNVSYKQFIYTGLLSEQYSTMIHFVKESSTNILTAWSDQVDRTVDLKATALPAPVVVYDMFGREVKRANTGEAFTFKLTADPHYIVISSLNPDLITKDFFTLGATTSLRSISIKEPTPLDSTQSTVEIYGSATNPPGEEELLYRNSAVTSGMNINYAWDAPIVRSESNQLLLYHMDQRSSLGETPSIIKDFSPIKHDGFLIASGGGSLEFGDSYGKFAGGFKAQGGQNARSIKVSNHPSLNNLSQFTIAFWIKKNADTGSTRLFCKGDASSYDVGLSSYCAKIRETGNELIFRVGDGTITRDRWSSLGLNADGLWHHIAFVFDGIPNAPELRRMDIYLDGKLNNGSLLGNLDGKCPIAQQGPSPTCPIPRFTKEDIHDLFILGYKSGGPAGLLSGSIDEFAMFSRALSSNEIASLAALKLGTPYYWFMRTIGSSTVTSQVFTESILSKESSSNVPISPYRLRIIQ
jgi:hypothetical protein